MEDVDYPRAWLRLKSYIGQGRGHGSDDLLAEMSRIEVECSEEHAAAQMARKGEGDGRQRSTQDRPPPDRDASASPTGAPETKDPLPQEGQGNGNGHRAGHEDHRDRRPAAVGG